MKRQVSVAGVAKREAIAERRRVKDAQDAAKKGKPAVTLDSFVNFQQGLGIGADNPLSTATYGFNPVTRIRTLLEWMHRGSWLAGVAIDMRADDMTRMGLEILGDMEPDQMESIDEASTALAVWSSFNEVIKWGGLYGGAIGVYMVDGQDYKTPLRLDTIAKGQFKGVVAFDRWQVEPILNDLVSDPGPDIGNPKFYRISSDAPALRNKLVHYSRCFRYIGIQLPFYARVQENLWGISILERLYDRMVSFDSATTGAAQLVYKAWIRTYAIEDLRDTIAAGGPAMEGLVKYVDMMRRFQGIEGITLLDSKDKMEQMQHSAFSGLSDVILQMAQQISGALQIPLVRLFGQSPAGLNSSGESDLRTYYDGILQLQEKNLRVPCTKIWRMLAQSEGIEVPEGFKIKFRPLWQLTDLQKAEIANTVSSAVVNTEAAGLISQQQAMKELKQSSNMTGIFTNITDEDIEAAAEELPPRGEEAIAEAGKVAAAGAEGKISGAAAAEKRQEKAIAGGDSILSTALAFKTNHDLEVAVENEKGSTRRGLDAGMQPWEAKLAADYGYIRRTTGADGDPLDAFFGSKPSSSVVWIIDQIDLATRAFDEHKCMLGFDNAHSALTAYALSYSDGRGLERIGTLKQMSMDQFKEWLAS